MCFHKTRASVLAYAGSRVKTLKFCIIIELHFYNLSACNTVKRETLVAIKMVYLHFY